MASKRKAEIWTEEMICPVCLDFFTDPVLLECGHNFCRSCITRCWERGERSSCPECREVFADRTLRDNRVLANLAERARNLDLNRNLHCEEHEEELKLLCETDKTLICLICRDAQEHREHRFIPINEAVTLYKGQLKSSVDSLTKKRSDFQEKEQQQKEKISRVQKQSHGLQTDITSQFAELRQIITEKEHSLLRDLREKETRILKTMEKNLRVIKEKIRIINRQISQLKEQMHHKDSVIFLKEEVRLNRRINDDAQELTMTDALPFEKFDHPYLLNTVLRETLDAINQAPVSVAMVVEDRKSVRLTVTRNYRPDTSKRFTNWECVVGSKRFTNWECVVGSKGFTSGRHYWEVEVARNRGWCLGVAVESVERNGGVRLSPETGFWVIGRDDDVLHQDCDEFGVLHSPESCLPVGPIPGRVGVYLSYESGTVSFYNAETKSQLYTYNGNKFTEKLYPFFAPWDENQWPRICSSSSPGLQMEWVPAPASGVMSP